MNSHRDAPECSGHPAASIDPRHRLWLERGAILGRWLRACVSVHGRRMDIGQTDTGDAASDSTISQELGHARDDASGTAFAIPLDSGCAERSSHTHVTESDCPDGEKAATAQTVATHGALVGICVLLVLQTAGIVDASEPPVHTAYRDSPTDARPVSLAATPSRETILKRVINAYRPDGLDDYAEDMRNFEPPAPPAAGIRPVAEDKPESLPSYALCTYFHSSEFSNGTVRRQREPFALPVRYANDPCAHLLPNQGRAKRPTRTIDLKTLRAFFHRPEFNELDGLDVY